MLYLTRPQDGLCKAFRYSQSRLWAAQVSEMVLSGEAVHVLTLERVPQARSSSGVTSSLRLALVFLWYL